MKTLIFTSTAFIAALIIFLVMCAGSVFGYLYECCLSIDKKIDAWFDRIFDGCF